MEINLQTNHDIWKYFSQSLLELKQNYPDLFQYQTIGFSSFHRPIFMIQLGHGSKNILYTGGVHGRESINPKVLLKMTHHYLENWSTYEDYFNTHSLFIIPLLNPDGYMITKQFPQWKSNGKDIDLNRNFPCSSWRKKFPKDTPESEPETYAMINVFEQIQPILYIDFHSRGEGIYYYRSSMDEAYNQRQQEIAVKLKEVTGYQLYEPEEEIPDQDTGGNTVQYFCETYGKPAITLETVPDEAEFPLDETYINSVFSQVYQIPFAISM